MEAKNAGRLFASSSLDAKEELDEKLERCYAHLQTIVSGVSEKEAHDALNVVVSKDSQNHEDISCGLLVAILAEPLAAPRFYRDLTFVTRDGLAFVLTRLNQLVLERYNKLHDSAKSQLIWLIKELIKNNVIGADGLCYNLLRQISGGDISSKNIWLTENMLDVFCENRSWLEKFPILMSTVIYTYLRLIVDHGSPALATLRQQEVDLTVSLLREKFSECSMIGRDLVRLLQNVARIPEFEKFWRDLLHNPASLSPGFLGVAQLMTMRTSRRFLLSRLTPDMEKKIFFLTSQVKFGTQKRYQEWFQRQYLATPESQSLRCDLIRFIIGVIHPTNELLCSDIIPRWAVIGWLLTTCTSNVAASNAKLSLFYDWLFYDPEKDNIMNIEPAILVMHHSMRTHPAITATLLDFLCRIIPNFYPPLADRVRQGIFTSLKQILEKRVLPTLSPLFDNPKLDKELRLMIREVFAEFCSSVEVKSEDVLMPRDPSESLSLESNHVSNNSTEHEAEFSEDEDDIPLAKVRLREMKFKPIKESPKLEHIDISDYVEQLDGDLKKYVVQLQHENIVKYSAPVPVASKTHVPTILLKTNCTTLTLLSNGALTDSKLFCIIDHRESWVHSFAVRGGKAIYSIEHHMMGMMMQKILAEIDKEGKKEELGNVGITLRLGVLSLVTPEESGAMDLTDNESRCEIMEKLVQAVIQEEDFDSDTGAVLAASLCALLSSQFEQKLFPQELDEESIEDSIGTPVFVMFRNLCQTPEEDPSRQPLLMLLADMYVRQAKVGYQLLYFLKASKINDDKMSTYRDFCKTMEGRDLEACLLRDLKLCQEDDVRLFCYLIPDIYTQFPNIAIGNPELLNLIVACIDSSQLQELVCLVLQGMVMFRKDSFLSVMNASLEWETFEQYCLWQLIAAHNIPVDYILPILPKLEFAIHAEALTSILLLLKQEKPTAELLKHIMCREVKQQDFFVVSVLKYWSQEHEEKLAELVATQLTKFNTTPNKRKRQPSHKPSGPSVEQTLAHLDQLRQNCKQTSFFNQEVVQQALQQVQMASSEAQKTKYSDLFTLAEDLDEGRSSHTKLRGNRKPLPPNKTKGKNTNANYSDTSEDSSEDDEILKPRPTKKRKRAIPVGSDSD